MTITLLTIAVQKLTAIVAGLSIMLSALTGQVADLETSNQSFGALIPVVNAGYESSLATKITSTATSLTLVSGVDEAGNALSGYLCFTISEGTASREFVCGTASSTAITGMIRGVDTQDGNLEVTALKKSHRRGDSVKITDYPIIGILARILNGDETIPNKLTYASQPTITGDEDIATKLYVDGVSISGVSDASFIAKGLVEIATKAQLASGASASTSDTTAFLVPSSAYYNVTSSATTSIPVTDVDGKLQQSYYDLAEPWTLTATTTLATTSITHAILNQVEVIGETLLNLLTVSGTSTLSTTSITHAIINQIELIGEAVFGNTLSVSSTTTLTGDLIVDSGTLYVDINDSRVGVGTTTPGYDLDVDGNARMSALDDTPIGKNIATTSIFTDSTSTNIAITGNSLLGTIVEAIIGASLTWSAAQDFSSQILTNINIDSGTIDGTTIGASSASTAKFSNTTSTFAEATTLKTSVLKLGNTVVTSNADELNKLDTTSANVTAANLNELTDGTSATTLHRHGMATNWFTTTTDGVILIPHTLGTTPSMIEITASTIDTDLMYSVGIATTTLNQAAIFWAVAPAAVQGGMTDDNNSILHIALQNGTNKWQGDLTTLDATNIGITLTETNDGGNLNIIWKAWY